MSKQPSNVVPLRTRERAAGGNFSEPVPPSVTELAEWTLAQALTLICTQDLREVAAASRDSGILVGTRTGLLEERRLLAAGADPHQGFPLVAPYFDPAWRRLLQDAAREPNFVVTGVWGDDRLPRPIPHSYLARAIPEFILDGEDRLLVPIGDGFPDEAIHAVRFNCQWCLNTYMPKPRARRNAKTFDQPRRTRRSRQAELAFNLMDLAEQKGTVLSGLSINDQLNAVQDLCEDGQELPERRLWSRCWRERQQKKRGFKA